MQIDLNSILSLENFKGIQRSLMDLDDLKFNGGIEYLTIGEYSVHLEFNEGNFEFENIQIVANILKQFYTLKRIDNNLLIFHCEALKKERELK
jgi:hypothetical protein